MRSLAAIRTNKWTEEEERLLARLRLAFGDDVAVVFHDRAGSVQPPVQVIDINGAWVARNGLFHVPDWGWRCGDYFYYALRQARPDYDVYWLIEPDVHFTSDPTPFFGRFETDRADALGYQLGPFTADIRFTRGLPDMARHRAIFALTRFSGRALDRLFALRRAMAGRAPSQRDYPNDEVFAFSHVAADAELTSAQIEGRAADWFEGVQFATDPDLLHDLLAETATAGRVFHPVRSREGFVRALGRRMAGNTGIALRMRRAVKALTDAEVEAVGQAAAQTVRQALDDLRASRAEKTPAAQSRKA
jgi:hypothetical protein